MIPEIFRFGPLPINSFGLMVMLGILTAWRFLVLRVETLGHPPELAEEMAFHAGLGGIVGARLCFLVSFPDEFLHSPLRALFSSSGFVFYGGLFGGAAAVWHLLRRRKIKFLPLSDIVAPALAFGYAVGRIGCQLSGDGDYGHATDLPWGMSYPLGVVPTFPLALRVHPTPVYETLVSLAIGVILLVLLNRKTFSLPGRLFGLYLVLSSLSRFLVEIIRIEPKVLFWMTQAQVEACALAAIGLLLLLRRGGEAKHL